MRESTCTDFYRERTIGYKSYKEKVRCLNEYIDKFRSQVSTLKESIVGGLENTEFLSRELDRCM